MGYFTYQELRRWIILGCKVTLQQKINQVNTKLDQLSSMTYLLSFKECLCVVLRGCLYYNFLILVRLFQVLWKTVVKTKVTSGCEWKSISYFKIMQNMKVSSIIPANRELSRLSRKTSCYIFGKMQNVSCQWKVRNMLKLKT